MKQKPIVRLIPLLGLIVLCIAIVSLTNSLINTNHHRTILQTRKIELTKLQQKTGELDTELQMVQSPEFVEKEAREKLNLAKLGETVILMGQTGTNNEAKQPSVVPTSTWKQWWKVFF